MLMRQQAFNNGLLNRAFVAIAVVTIGVVTLDDFSSLFVRFGVGFCLSFSFCLGKFLSCTFGEEVGHQNAAQGLTLANPTGLDNCDYISFDSKCRMDLLTFEYLLGLVRGSLGLVRGSLGLVSGSLGSNDWAAAKAADHVD